MSDTATAAASVKHTKHHQSTLPRLTDQPWWTQADQAEVSALWGEWVNGAWEHKTGCAICAAGGMCEHCRSALDVVLEFREQRIRVSKAQWLRVMNDAGLTP